MVHRPSDISAFEFAVLAGLRASQLSRGCLPRVTRACKIAVTAQMEIAEGKVVRSTNLPVVALDADVTEAVVVTSV